MVKFLKNNWLYIILLSLIIAINVLPRAGEKQEKPAGSALLSGEKQAAKKKGQEGLFVNFKDAQDKSARIESALMEKPALYLFYISTSLYLLLPKTCFYKPYYCKY